MADLIRNRLLSEFYVAWRERQEQDQNPWTMVFEVTRDEFEQFEEELHPCERIVPQDRVGMLLPIPSIPMQLWPRVKPKGER